MNIEELFELTLWVDSEIITKKIGKLYANLFNVLNQSLQPNQPKQPFEQQKAQLVEAIISVDLPRLSIDQLRFLDKLNILNNVGTEGARKVEDILVNNPIDLATAAKYIQVIVGEINKGIEKSNQIKVSLSDFVDLEPDAGSDVLIRVSFSGNASMGNVADFKKWGAEWHTIGRGLAMAHGATPQDIRIVGAKKGSIVIELAVACGIAKTVSIVLLESLKVAERIFEIKKAAEEVRALRLGNHKISKEIEEEAVNEKQKCIDSIVAAVKDQLGTEIAKQGDHVKALHSSVEKLVDFLEKGGEVDCVVPNEDKSMVSGEDKARQLSELRNNVANIRVLEQKIKQLEYKI